MADSVAVSPTRALGPTVLTPLVVTDSLRLGCPAPSWCPAYPPTPAPTSAPTGPPTTAPTTPPPVAPTAVPFSDRSISLQVAQLAHTETSVIALARRMISSDFIADPPLSGLPENRISLGALVACRTPHDWRVRRAPKHGLRMEISLMPTGFTLTYSTMF